MEEVEQKCKCMARFVDIFTFKRVLCVVVAGCTVNKMVNNPPTKMLFINGLFNYFWMTFFTEYLSRKFWKIGSNKDRQWLNEWWLVFRPYLVYLIIYFRSDQVRSDQINVIIIIIIIIIGGDSGVCIMSRLEPIYPDHVQIKIDIFKSKSMCPN